MTFSPKNRPFKKWSVFWGEGHGEKVTGVSYVRFHDLRHTFARLLLAENVPAKYIQDQLGHSSIKTTMDRYSHLMPEVHQQGIKALDNFFKEEKEIIKRFGT